jgi:malonate-semialdehyde dehydrogenase (acetylating)/methylmalonate-semialdehyde dehydrogenase
MTIAKEEIFGPVVAVIRVRDIDEALAQIRNQAFGNGACVFTQNLYYAGRFIQDADVGMVGVNVGICAPHPYLPFGGIKDSLLGTDKVQGKGGINFFYTGKDRHDSV